MLMDNRMDMENREYGTQAEAVEAAIILESVEMLTAVVVARE
jgi:hypothetical protein